MITLFYIANFKRAQRYGGMIDCSYPNYGPKYYNRFLIYYILILYDLMMYFDDEKLIKYHMPTVNRTLTEEGLVAKNGGLNFKRCLLVFYRLDRTMEGFPEPY